MKTLTIALLTLVANSVFAQERPASSLAQPSPAPVLQATQPDDANRRLDLEIGAVRLTTHSGRYTLAYLPFLAPLPGTALRASMEMPNALTLTGTTIPQRPDTRRSVVIRDRD